MTVLGPPDHCAIGCSDIETAAGFLTAFGFIPAGDSVLPASIGGRLYGLTGDAPQRRLVTPGARHGGVRIVQSPDRRARASTLDVGGYAIDVYSRDIERSRADLRSQGLTCTGIVRWRLGAAAFAQLRVDGPGGLRVIVVEGPRRRSVLDHDEGRLHSEVQSYVFVVADVRDDDAFWPKAGLAPLYQSTLPPPPGFDTLLDLPDSVTSLGLALHWCPDRPDGPARVELLGLAGSARNNEGRLMDGLTAVCFAVDDVQAAARQLAGLGVAVTVATASGHPAVAYGTSPAGVAFEIWPR